MIYPFSSPVKPTGHIAILEGNLAPEGSVGKITGKEGMRFQGCAVLACFLSSVIRTSLCTPANRPARCFDAEEDMMAAVSRDHESLRGCVIVIRCACYPWSERKDKLSEDQALRDKAIAHSLSGTRALREALA